MNFALSWFPSSYSSKLPLVFQHSLPWLQYTLDNDSRVLRSFRKIRFKHAPLRSRQQPPWRHCRFQISSVAVHISFLEANSNPRVLGQDNKGVAEIFHSHTLLMTSEFWLWPCPASAAYMTSACDAVWPCCFAWLFYLLHRIVASYSLPMLKVIFLDHVVAVPPYRGHSHPCRCFSL